MLAPRRIRTHFANLISSWHLALTNPTYALPVDGFRILVGVLGFIYFFQLIREVPDISAPDGYLDHALLQEALWFLRWNLFQPGMQSWHFYGIFSLGLLVCMLVIVGWHPKWAAAYLYLITVSTYRWNFLVSYLDDSLMHLAFVWLLLLPIGRTLTLHGWLREGPAAWRRWQETLVPGLAVHSFLGNLGLIYLVAGLWKWTSPMWLDGSALYAGLNMPISLAADFWQPAHFPVLQVFNYVALLLEPVLIFLVVLPRNHPLKWLLVAGAAGLHVGICLTLRIPYANAICLSGLVLVLRDEGMGWLRSPTANHIRPPASPRIDRSGKLACALVTLLALTMLGDTLPWWIEPGSLSRQRSPDGLTLLPGQVVADWRSRHNANNVWGHFAPDGNPLYVPLWLAGLAQKYRLFDWIDDVNYVASYEIRDGPAVLTGNAALERLFPMTARGVILQAYVNDVRWVILPPSQGNVVKQSLFERIARRYCQAYASHDQVEVFVTVERITVDNLQLNQGMRERFMAFECTADWPSMNYMRLARL